MKLPSDKKIYETYTLEHERKVYGCAARTLDYFKSLGTPISRQHLYNVIGREGKRRTEGQHDDLAYVKAPGEDDVYDQVVFERAVTALEQWQLICTNDPPARVDSDAELCQAAVQPSTMDRQRCIEIPLHAFEQLIGETSIAVFGSGVLNLGIIFVLCFLHGILFGILLVPGLITMSYAAQVFRCHRLMKEAST